MTYRGRLTNGVVILDSPTALPDGTAVRVEPATEPGSDDERALLVLSEKLLGLVGTAKGLPHDMARNHDHYLHGHPKK